MAGISAGVIAAYIAVAATVAAAAAGAYAAYASSQAQAQAADYQRKVSKNQAQAAKQAAEIGAENARVQHQRVLATQRNRLGATGVLPSEGSPLLVQMESAESAALDEARIRYSGEVQATGYRSNEILAGFEAKTARQLGYVGVGTSLLGGATRAYSGYSGSTAGATSGAGAGTSTGYQYGYM